MSIDYQLLSSYFSVHASPSATAALAQSVFGRDAVYPSGAPLAATVDSKTASLRRSFNPQNKFTFFTAATGMMQGNTLSKVLSNVLPPMGGAAGLDRVASAPFWLDLFQPSAADLAVLAQIFRIHPVCIDGLLTGDVREKCEVYDHYLYLSLATLADNAESIVDDMALRETYYHVLLFADCVITVRREPLRHTFNVLLRLLMSPGLCGDDDGTGRKQQQRAAQQPSANKRSSLLSPVAAGPSGACALAPDWVAYAVVSDMVDGAQPTLRGIEAEADELERQATGTEDLATDATEALLERVRCGTKRTAQIGRLLAAKEELIKRMLKRKFAYFQPATQVYLRDVLDRIVTMKHALAMVKETLTTAHADYHTRITWRTSAASRDSEQKMRTMSLIGAAFVPVTGISAVFGLETQVPGMPHPEAGFTDEGHIVFISLLLMMAMVAAGHVLVLRRSF
ncbi:CorA metal ion transporter [Blastocladiella emersonii ATCC 22665]|nr:CorA metal ion transporter [Blastocladiella emersonii ATCC 22665]